MNEVASTRGIIRTIDDLGRICIPLDLRKTLLINSGDEIEIIPHDDDIFLKVHRIKDSAQCELDKTIHYINRLSEIDEDLRTDLLSKLYEARELLTRNEK